MHTDFLLEAFSKNRKKEAIIWKNKSFDYQWLLDHVHFWKKEIQKEKIASGTVVILEADFSPTALALLLVLIDTGCIIVPLTSSVESQKSEFIKIVEGEVIFKVDDGDHVNVSKVSHSPTHEYINQLKAKRHPGLVLFSSGSTGKSKASLSDFSDILSKFKVPRHSLRTIAFLLFDHIGGINTLLYTLSNAGCVVVVNDRTPESVLQAVDKYKVELLPTSPTFINLILLSEAYKKCNLSSLKTVTYGTEPMPESTLKRFHELFPEIQLKQTYGLSELGILRSKSKGSDSLWVKIGGEDFKTRVVGGLLEIKAKSAMLGYLNAPSPFTEDGWFKTGDSVLTDGEYIKILGRESEIINVGGEKVYPTEVESVIQEMDNIAEVTVFGKKNAITGNMVCAKVRLEKEDNPKTLSIALKKFCRERLQAFKIPVKVEIVDKKQHSKRFKKLKRQED
jgi:acyl-CoA synthetase (AMP-forming)/AMP-acid ligase II|tara:strand:- start:1896 stop:3245 length:1350 start_codon:yes stop_codon:yes gene_type:complete